MSRRPAVYHRRDGVELREVGDEIFLIDLRNGRIHYLNATGAALWRLLADPLRLSALVRTFRDAFPTPTRRIQKKLIKRLLEELEDNDLLRT